MQPNRLPPPIRSVEAVHQASDARQLAARFGEEEIHIRALLAVVP